MNITTGPKNSKDIALKLHKQFAHPTPEKLIKLIRNANVNDKSLEENIISISKDCLTCIRHQRPTPRPKVSLPMACKFNEAISMDLKIYDKHFFFGYC